MSGRNLGKCIVFQFFLLFSIASNAQVDIPIVQPSAVPVVVKHEFYVAASGGNPAHNVEQYVVVYDSMRHADHITNFVNSFLAGNQDGEQHTEVIIARAGPDGEGSLTPRNLYTQQLLAGQTEHFGSSIVDANVFWDGVPKELIETFESSKDLPVFSATVPVVNISEKRFGSSQLSFMTISRVVLTGGISSAVVYFSAESVTSLLAVGLSTAYFPAIEYFFQTYADEYANWLKKSKLPGRVGKRLAVGAATLFVYSYLQSTAGISTFEVWDFLRTIGFSTLATHPFYELVVSDKPKSKFFEGKTVSYALGLIGLGGVILSTMKVDVAGLPVGDVILGSLAVSGAVSVVHTFGMKSLIGSVSNLLGKAKNDMANSLTGMCHLYRKLTQK